MARPGYHWRALSTLDLPALERMAAEVHPGFFEALDVLAERQALYPDGTMLLEMAGEPAGYVLSHPWRSLQLPALNTRLGAIPPDADTFYIHDLALLPVARGTGAAAGAVETLASHARRRGFATMSLVAVNGSAGFWGRQGFAKVDAPALARKLASYEDAARLMMRQL
ncbi:GNAT family N-acetyltransferase [Arsenicitalea aurantiaca]|uniref:GNAT family N-acetyltransferase n=1 Tax=Arsenicitalea aurantiaca TaxID=1783274 RepID=A0A433X8A9_9HYPH|nr:GNAT family N-acetyltransferase [Arsenicitalea aurantiaca]RUT30305.1 GNAT family N-acetyltransferase [Arsenicitalea aurantiaca]